MIISLSLWMRINSSTRLLEKHSCWLEVGQWSCLWVQWRVNGTGEGPGGVYSSSIPSWTSPQETLSLYLCVCVWKAITEVHTSTGGTGISSPPPSLPSLKPNAEVVFSLESDASLSLSLSSEVIESFIKMASYKLSGLSEEEISKDLN